MTVSHNPPYSSLTVANSFLKLGEEQGDPVSSMKLLKLVYIAHGWYLALTGRPLISDTIEAWKWGPVIPSLYRKVKRYGSGAITEKIDTGDAPEAVPASDVYGNRLVEYVWKAYGRKRAIDLSMITHKPGSPWHEVVSQYLGKTPHNLSIPSELIQKHYRELYDEITAPVQVSE